MLLNRQKTNQKGAKALWFSPSTFQTYAYQALPDCLFFGSTLEFETYRRLALSGIPFEYLKTQVNFEIKPKTDRYPVLNWRCDLVLDPPKHSALPYLLIESKGEVTPEFKIKLQFLQYFQPEKYERLVVVTDKKPKRIDAKINSINHDTLLKLIEAMSQEF